MQSFVRGAILTLSLLLFLCPHASAQQALSAESVAVPVATTELPMTGTFRSLTLMQPPFPFHPFPGLPVYALADGSFVYDDSQVDYVALKSGLLSFSSSSVLLGGGGMQTMSLNSPPPPGGGGGSGGSSGGDTNGAYSVPGLKLTIPVLTNGLVLTSLMEADTNSAYDLFERFVFATNRPWARIAGADIGVTNFAVTKISPTNAFYLAADTTDSDFDGLSDAFETLVSKSNPLLQDSDNDGIPDGLEDSNTNAVPDRYDYARQNRAVIFASKTNAFEGGQNGELTILLPAPAPTNGTPITLHLGGNTDADYDYRLTTSGGAAISNVVYFNAGQAATTVLVVASNNTTQESRVRRMQAALLQSPNFSFSTEPATVTLVDNDLPRLSLLALDRKAKEDAGLGTNTAAFLFRREGSLEGFLGAYFARSGTAVSGVDYILSWTNSEGTGFVLTENNPALIYPGFDSQILVVTPLVDAIYEDTETITLTMLPDGLDGYATIDSTAATATVQLLDDDLPVVNFVGVDLAAAEYGGNTATVTLRRNGLLAQALTVEFNIAGTATRDADYQSFTNRVVISAGATDYTFAITPILNTAEEQAENILITLRGSLAYAIGSSNSVTVWIDDDSPTRYQTVPIKTGAVNSSTPNVTSPAVYEVRRFGRSSAASTVPFAFFTNSPTGLRRTLSVAASGDLDATQTNLVFVPWGRSAQVKALPPVFANPTQAPQYYSHFSTVGPDYWPFNLRRLADLVTLTIVQTNAIEGTTSNALIRITRMDRFTQPAVAFTVTGAAIPAGASDSDHNLPAAFTLTLASNAFSIETNITATTDATLEGWESVVITPDRAASTAIFDPQKPLIAFLRENVTDTTALPEGDLDNDGAGDHWEVLHGLDPLDPGDGALDPDKDGLTNTEESLLGTNPLAADTDGDGVNDCTEHAQGSSPLDPLDNGLSPEPGTTLPLRLRLGDHSGSHSEQWELNVGALRRQSPAPGVVEETVLRLPRGSNYPIRLKHMFSTLTPADYDYTAILQAEPTNAPAGFLIDDPQLLLGVHDNDSNYVTKTATLIVPRIEVTWESVANSGILDANPAIGAGMRYYPDQQSPTDTTDRRKLFVRVKTKPPLPGKTIRLRALDVDDPTRIVDDMNLVIDSNDTFGLETGNDNRSTPQAGQLFETSLTLDVLGEAATFFTVGLQPGDNYRVAAILDTTGAQSHLDQLQVANEALPMFVPSGTNQVPDFVGALSPMLTVWRKLHLEFDSMGAPPTSGPEALYEPVVLLRVFPNRPVAGHSQVTLIWTNGFEGLNHYERGKLEIAGVGTFRTLNSWTRVAGGTTRTFTEVEIDTVLSTNTVGLSAKLYDDDSQYLGDDPLYPSNLGLQSPPLPALAQATPFIQTAQPKFATAYITLVDVNLIGWNTQQNISFKRYIAPYLTTGTILDNGNLQLKGTDRSEFWAFSVVFAYQPTTVFGLFGIGPVIDVALFDDGDSDSETPLSGSTRKHPLTGTPEPYSAVFLEAIRDLQFQRRAASDPNPSEFTNALRVPFLRSKYAQSVYGVIAHEIAHAPGRESEGSDHSEGDIMEGPVQLSSFQFNPKTIRRFRSATSWTN